VGKIQQCVRDVLSIAGKMEDFGQAKTQIEQLFLVSNAQRRGHLAVAQRVRDQINRAYDDVPPDAQLCLDRVLEWLDREHLQQRQQAD
jgi:2-polyprenyl-6-methoxyphenol hydroxylase-like FAD-dependent oxidoreductase